VRFPKKNIFSKPDITNMKLIKVKWCKLRNYTERLGNGLSFLASVVLSVHKELSEMCVPKYKMLFNP